MPFAPVLLAAALAATGTTAGAEQAPAASPAQEEQPPEAPEPPPEPPAEATDVVYRADRVRYLAAGKTVLLEGNVVLERSGGRLHAARATIERQAGTATLEGGVLAIEGTYVALAEAAVVDLRSQAADLRSATMFVKDRAAAAGLASLTDRGAARTRGKNTLTLRGTSVRKLADGTLLARDVSLTPCDCAGSPDYDILADEVRVGRERAELPRARLRLFGVTLGGPLLLGVPLSVPLTDRQSGMLPPKFGVALTSGFGLVQPVFLTLGRSWDATVSPGFFLGAGAPAVPAGAGPNFRAELFHRTVRGPRLDLELRGAPAAGTSIKLNLDTLYDADASQSVASDANAFGVPGSKAGRGFGGFRGVLRASERTEAAWGNLALDGALASDAMIVSDAQANVVDRFADALRTDVGAWRRMGPAVAGVEATLLQDVRVPNPGFPDRRAFGEEARRTFQRLPSAFAQLPAVPLGPVALSGELSVARFFAFRSLDAQEQQTGFGASDLISDPSRLVATPVTDRWGLARAPLTRLDVAPRLAASIAEGAYGSVTAIAGGRADAWFFDEDSARNRRRAYGLAGLRADTELSRPFGALLHTVRPSVELRALTRSIAAGGPPIGDPTDGGGLQHAPRPLDAQQGVGLGVPLRDAAGQKAAGVPAARRPYDEIDGAAPERGAGQAVLRVDQALWRSGGTGRAPARVLELTLAQDLLLWAGGGKPRLGEGWVAGSLRLGVVELSTRAALDWSTAELTAAAAAVRLSDGRGDAIHAGVQALRGVAPELIRAGADELFATARLASVSGDLAGTANAGAVVRLPFDRLPVSLAWSLDRFLGTLPNGTPDTVHHFAASIDTPCRCAGVQAALDLPFANGSLGTVGVRFVLDLKQLGSFGTP